ncbi:dihydrofolate reductase [Breoghania corrubedonensis]|uniref:Dihydrofolate reductase n=1 Tax=Breoghania corrubedonensis TaxID=665038 RepID=A0A2T5V4U2_9HYPH|nr:dihydrofolate reductase [Breoghania corrubedonensis]PTW58772.1 dihydrofolate reductase [Breoghania corrubedonensis]
MSVHISLIAAVAENGVIGRDNDMPWKLTSDLKRFKALTLGKPIVMGRKTFESIGRPLPGRPNIVVTRNPDFAAQGIRVVSSLEAGLELARELAAELGVGEVMVIGGGALYAEAIATADRLYITQVHARPPGDTRFPEIDPASWREVSREACVRAEGDSAETSFVTYHRGG